MGIDVNTKGSYDIPAIIIAVLHEKIEVIDLLLSKNVDLEAEDQHGRIAIDYFNDFQNVQKVKKIKEKYKEKFKKFRQRIAQQIYNDLEEFKFPQDHADLISEYLV